MRAIQQPHRYTGSFSSQTLTKNRQKNPVFWWFIFRRSCIRSTPAQLREQRRTLWWWRFTTSTLWLCLSLWTPHTVNLRNESQRNWTSRRLICASGNCTAVSPLLSVVSSSWQTNTIRVRLLQCVQTSDIYIKQKIFISCIFLLLCQFFIYFPADPPLPLTPSSSLIRRKHHGSCVLTPLDEEIESAHTVQQLAEAGRATLWCQVCI